MTFNFYKSYRNNKLKSDRQIKETRNVFKSGEVVDQIANYALTGNWSCPSTDPDESNTVSDTFRVETL